MSQEDIKCEDVGCAYKGYWIESAESGEKLVHSRVRHEREWHVNTINLAELTVQMIKRDQRFAEYFNLLLKK